LDEALRNKSVVDISIAIGDAVFFDATVDRLVGLEIVVTNKVLAVNHFDTGVVFDSEFNAFWFHYDQT
jgi:hypothetical protein